MAQAIHQTLIAAAPGDAVTGSALEMRRLLRDIGPSEIYAHHIHDDLRHVVRPLAAFHHDARHGDTRLMIVHLSMGDPIWLEFVLSLRTDLAVSYHNMTPPEYFDPWDPKLANLLRFGRETMPLLVPRAALTMADSAYNARELEDAGFSDVHVAGLIVDAGALARTAPDRAVLEASSRRPGPTILHVGQLFPHKRIETVLLAFAELRARGHDDATLVLAGSSRLSTYRRAVEQLVIDLDLCRHVEVTGHLSPQQLSAHYRTADAFMIASEHEGFCVPLIEAMTFEVPIVTRARGAIAETAGDAAVVLGREATPAQMSIALDAVLCDRPAADALRRRERARAEKFTLERQRLRFLEALSSAV